PLDLLPCPTRRSSDLLVLYLPDEILVVDHYSAKAWTDRYDYAGDGFSTADLPREGAVLPYTPSDRVPPRGDHAPGEYAELVRRRSEEHTSELQSRENL